MSLEMKYFAGSFLDTVVGRGQDPQAQLDQMTVQQLAPSALGYWFLNPSRWELEPTQIPPEQQLSNLSKFMPRIRQTPTPSNGKMKCYHVVAPIIISAVACLPRHPPIEIWLCIWHDGGCFKYASFRWFPKGTLSSLASRCHCQWYTGGTTAFEQITHKAAQHGKARHNIHVGAGVVCHGVQMRTT
jgi:hypothetical protein